jgi:hypothetical protein
VDLTKWTELFTFSVIGKVGFGFDFEAIEKETHPYLEQIQVRGPWTIAIYAASSVSYAQAACGVRG